MNRKSRRYSSTSRWGLARALAALGGLIALVGFTIGIVNSMSNTINITAMLYSLAGIIVSIFVLLQVQLVKNQKLAIPFNWWLLLILIILQAIIARMIGPFISIAGLGLLLEVIAVIILIIEQL
ncbi:MAG: hypothetical protein K9W44_01400 [Candidatus Lokiarchaeota archaeon]|nr:hypothetical protein [Candidatus Harpocratesius repetitus]